MNNAVTVLLTALALATALPAWAQGPRADAVERSLVGHWAGALEYRDYRSNRKFELPVRTVVQIGADGATLTRVATFDDGPSTGNVHITTVSLFDATGQRVSSATFRKGREVELWTADARVQDYADANHWTLVFQHRGSDDDKPADIRITQTRRGDELVVLKEVRPAGTADGAWNFRNQTVLRRQP